MSINNLLQILSTVYTFVNFIQYDFNSEVLHECRDLKIYQQLGTVLCGHIYPIIKYNLLFVDYVYPVGRLCLQFASSVKIYSHAASLKRS